MKGPEVADVEQALGDRYSTTGTRGTGLGAVNRLMDELSGTENRIAVERMRYNERIQEYNTARRRFPGNLTAKMFSFKEYPFFEAPAEAKQVPKVNFKPS